MASISKHLVTTSANLSPLEVLHATPDVLLGVPTQALTVLKTLDIQTVFDLASLRIFSHASMLLEAGTDPRSVLARYGVPPADVIGLLPPGVSIDQLRLQDIDILEGIGTVNAPGVSAALHVKTCRTLLLAALCRRSENPSGRLLSRRSARCRSRGTGRSAASVGRVPYRACVLFDARIR